jgi:hypothetical protein
MAYMSQERKKALAPKIKAVLKKYGMKGTISVRNNSSLQVSIKSGKLDMLGNFNATVSTPYAQRAVDCIDVNPYHYKTHFTGQPLAFVTELMSAMNEGNWDKSDIMTDYFNVGWYVGVYIGRYDEPYVMVK